MGRANKGDKKINGAPKKDVSKKKIGKNRGNIPLSKKGLVYSFLSYRIFDTGFDTSFRQ